MLYHAVIAAKPSPDIVRTLLENGADANNVLLQDCSNLYCRRSFLNSVLFFALINGFPQPNKNIIKCLLEFGAQIPQDMPLGFVFALEDCELKSILQERIQPECGELLLFQFSQKNNKFKAIADGKRQIKVASAPPILNSPRIP